MSSVERVWADRERRLAKQPGTPLKEISAEAASVSQIGRLSKCTNGYLKKMEDRICLIGRVQARRARTAIRM